LNSQNIVSQYSQMFYDWIGILLVGIETRHGL
jgi:hypothetical protein